MRFTKVKTHTPHVARVGVSCPCPWVPLAREPPPGTLLEQAPLPRACDTHLRFFGVPGDQALRPRGPRPRRFGGPSPALGCLARPPPWEGLIRSPAAPRPRAGRLHPQATARSSCAIWALRDATSTGPPQDSAAGKGCRGPARGGPICSPKASPGPNTRHGASGANPLRWTPGTKKGCFWVRRKKSGVGKPGGSRRPRLPVGLITRNVAALTCTHLPCPLHGAPRFSPPEASRQPCGQGGQGRPDSGGRAGRNCWSGWPYFGAVFRHLSKQPCRVPEWRRAKAARAIHPWDSCAKPRSIGRGSVQSTADEKATSPNTVPSSQSWCLSA